ncbi:SPW repeat protein [Chelativorans sp. AA-79]|uniref:SPW repeat domain-containing protein n=1 Tax=Chelativorans sp. AA-79 TaxID=3028735 RepID=UPI0023F9C2E3|nr:SPW repeat protein [Chelativorans sp. AA-79]WEX07515.1 SPW repeat protein [Chelativorans sp. AA-79]
MQFIPTRIHGVLDYLVGILLIVAPWLLGFANGGAAQWVPVVLGLGVIVYSLLTNYELGVIRVISMPVHLALDVIGGIVLASSPWLFGFQDQIIWPHLVVGIIEVVTAASTDRQPGRPRA